MHRARVYPIGNAIPPPLVVLTARPDDLCAQAVLRKISDIQGEDEFGVARFSAKAERIVFGIRRDLECVADFDCIGSFANQIDDPANHAGADVKPPQNLLVFVQDLFTVEPSEVVFLRPVMERISARIPAGNIVLAEPGNASH